MSSGVSIDRSHLFYLDAFRALYPTHKSNATGAKRIAKGRLASFVVLRRFDCVVPSGFYELGTPKGKTVERGLFPLVCLPLFYRDHA